MISDKLLYQYGNADEPCYVFFKNQFTGTQMLGVKEQRADSSFIDGSVRLNRAEKNKRTGQVINYDFANMFFSYGSNDITRIFYSEPKLAFWLEVEDFDPDNPELFRNVSKVYYALADCIVPPTFIESEKDNRATPQQDYSVSFMLDKPYVYDCTADVQYYDSTLPVVSSLWGTMVYGSDVWGSTQTISNVSGLTPAEKTSYFINIDPKNISKFLLLKDRFFRRDVTAGRNYVFNQSVSTTVTVQTTNAFRSSPVDNNIYRIELSGMTPSGSVTLQNLSNDSGIKITWLSPTSEANVVYNSFYNALYDSNGDKILDSKYIVEAVGSSILYFTGLRVDAPVGITSNESVRATNDNSTTTDIKIDALIAY